jgi:hypothetical protein
VALALIYSACGWVVRRRLQRRESADWLLVDSESQAIALEVSGLDAGSLASRLRLKLEQVRNSTIAQKKAACVVEIASPRAELKVA